MLDGGEDDDGQLAVLHAPGYVPVGQAAAAAEPSTENVAFFQQLLRQRGDGNAAWSAPMASIWWLASNAAVPVSHCSSSTNGPPRCYLPYPLGPGMLRLHVAGCGHEHAPEESLQARKHRRAWAINHNMEPSWRCKQLK